MIQSHVFTCTIDKIRPRRMPRVKQGTRYWIQNVLLPTHTHRHTPTPAQNTHKHTHTHTCTHMHTHTLTHTHTQTHTLTQTQTHTHMHRQTDRQTDRQTHTHTHTSSVCESEHFLLMIEFFSLISLVCTLIFSLSLGVNGP